MEKLQSKCESMCQMSRRGGRFRYVDQNTVHIADIDKWTSEMTEEITSYMPNITIDIMSSSQSITGFIVLIRKRPTQYLRAWGWIICMVALAIVSIRELRLML